MNQEEEIKKRILQQRMQEHAAQAGEQQQMQEALKLIMFQVLDSKARERLANLKMVKPELALQLEAYLAQVYQAGQIKEKITEEKLVAILKKLSESEKKDIRIKRITK
ncbi:MAG: hypothetical protein HYT72_04735 [Candidatus Aenigmarchaeota archaeon]|nr:hypothetical protein [Candidatus Aenigmarchaeota archaeon]